MTATADHTETTQPDLAVERSWSGLLLIVLAASVALRLSTSAMWLDEAQTVAIAHRSFSGLFSGLRVDGSPPLFYLVLHWWMAAFGTGNVAVRLLPLIFSILAVVLAPVAARRLGLGRRSGEFAAILMATSPFAIHYASEARMYSLVMLLSVVAIIVFERVYHAGKPWHIASAALVTAALLLTQYWSIFFGVAGGGLALVLAIRGNRAARRVVVAILIGCVPFIPWLPTFLYQLRHTGAPWGTPPGVDTFVLAPSEWGGADTLGFVVSVAYYLLIVAAIVTHRRDGRLTIGRPVRIMPAFIVGLCLVGLLLGCLDSEVTRQAYADRYSSLAFAPVLIAASAALSVIPRQWQRRVVAGIAIAGLGASVTLPFQARTQANEVADHLRAAAQPGDVVVFCPDQLGPAVHRLVPNTGTQVVYPNLSGPEIVNWVDYANRVKASNPMTVAQRINQLAGEHSVWLVYATDYPLFTSKCSELLVDLAQFRGAPRNLVTADTSLVEHESLAEFGQPSEVFPAPVSKG